jgi:hypothetical protein
MYIESVPNRKSPPAILLRESYREGGKVKKRTLCNLTHWPPAQVEGLRRLLRGGTAVERLEESLEVVRSRPHGHVAAVLGTARRQGLEGLLSARRCPERDRVLAMIVARVVNPRSKLATARALDLETLDSTLGELLGLASADADELYAALDWLGERQERIEQKLAARHLAGGSLVLYDVTSTYFEGRCCPLARLGHSRDGKPDRLQIVFGLLCNAEGCPVAVEVFEGNVSDPKTFSAQVQKVRQRFGIERIVWVGDRGMITEARIREDLRGVEGLDWITALRAPQIRELVSHGALQLSLFDERDLAEITSDEYPGERLIACRNPRLAEERARKREELLAATEQRLDLIVAATRRAKRPLRGEAAIALRVGKVLGRFKMAKHFRLRITDEGFDYERDRERIAAEAALDGIYVIRTTVPAETLGPAATVGAYKSLSRVERAFRSYKSVDLKVRPIFHHLATRVRAHVFLCMLAYYVEWHMRQALAPILFDDHNPRGANQRRASIVAPAQRSREAQRKLNRRRTADGLPVHSFRSLLDDLRTIVRNRLQPTDPNLPAFDKTTQPTPLQQRALDLLGVRL